MCPPLPDSGSRTRGEDGGGDVSPQAGIHQSPSTAPLHPDSHPESAGGPPAARPGPHRYRNPPTHTHTHTPTSEVHLTINRRLLMEGWKEGEEEMERQQRKDERMVGWRERSEEKKGCVQVEEGKNTLFSTPLFPLFFFLVFPFFCLHPSIIPPPPLTPLFFGWMERKK